MEFDFYIRFFLYYPFYQSYLGACFFLVSKIICLKEKRLFIKITLT